MGLISYALGQTGVVLRVKVLDSGTLTGGKTGLTSASSGLVVSTIGDNEATATAYSGANLETVTTLGTYAAPTSGKARFREVDATNHKGVYEIQIADARFAVSSAKSLLVSISGASGACDCDVVIPLVTADPYSATRQLDMTQSVPTSNTDETVGDCLNAARADGFGKWVLSGTALTLYAADGTTVVRTFTLDSASLPTQRT